MTITNIALVKDALKTEYLPALRVQFNDKADPLLAQLEGDTTLVNGDQINMAFRYGRTGGLAALSSDIADLPNTNARKTKQATFGTKNLVARIMISDKTIKASRNNVAAFANLLQQELEDAKTDAVDDLSRQVYGNGSGKLCTCTAQNTVNALVVDKVDFLAEGMFVDILHNDGSTLVAGREVTAVDDTTNTVTISGAAVTTLVTDFIVRSGNYNAEVTGLDAVFAQTGDIYGLSRTTYPWLKAQQIAHNGEIDEVILQKGIDEAMRKAGATINYMSTSLGIARAWQKYQLTFKQNVNFLELKGGWKAMSYTSPDGQIAIRGTKYAPAGKIRLLDLSHWFLPMLADWEFMDDDGAMLARVSGKAAYEATMVKYCDLVTDLVRGNVEITGVTEH